MKQLDCFLQQYHSDFQRKAKNMLFNIAQTKPALNFTPGQFIDQIPGNMVKFDKIYGKNDENIEGVPEVP